MSEERNNVEIIPEFKMYITDLETNKDSKEINVSDLIFNDYIEFQFGDYEDEDYIQLPYKDFKFFINDYSVTFYSPQIKDLQQKVEQLEKENKILKENAEHNDKVVDKVTWENMLLKGKLKDLKERIMLKQLRLVNEETYNILHSDLNELLEVLDREVKYEQ